MNKFAMTKHKKGFTIIELMLAMLFLSMLLVTIALLVIQITGIYQKGMSLRAVSSTGKQLIDEFTRVVGGSPLGRDIMPKPVANANDRPKELVRAVQQYFVSNSNSRTSSSQGVSNATQYGGTFCTGSYSYVWNTWYSMEDGQGSMYVINGKEPYRLARMSDPDRLICSQASAAGGYKTNLTISANDIIELINEDESDLILYNFTVFPATQQSLTGHSFYSATFILATIRGGINIKTTGDFCNVDQSGINDLSDVGSSDFDYCAVNKFNFAMRATGYGEGVDQYGEQGDKELR